MFVKMFILYSVPFGLVKGTVIGMLNIWQQTVGNPATCVVSLTICLGNEKKFFLSYLNSGFVIFVLYYAFFKSCKQYLLVKKYLASFQKPLILNRFYA